MDIRKRSAAIIVNDSKLLMVKGKESGLIWTPGGRYEEGETDEECLRRELKEELDCDMVSHSFVLEHVGPAMSPMLESLSRGFVVEISGNIRPSSEIGDIVWMEKDRFLNDEYPINCQTEKDFVQKLIDRNIW